MRSSRMMLPTNSSSSRSKDLAQVVVEVGKEVLVRCRAADIADVQPLAGEVVDERVGTRIGEHAPDLTLQLLGPAQPSCGRGVQQVVVRDAAPEEERQPRRQLEVAEAVNGSGLDPGGIALDAEDELRD